MKKVLTLTAALAASTLLATPALADFSPAPSSGTISGTLQLSQTVTINCDFTADYSVSSDGKTMTITNQVFSPGAPECALLGPAGAWIAVDNGSGVDITVNTTSLFGQCAGTISGVAWNNSFGGPSFVGATVPGTAFGVSAPCTIDGTLATNPKVTFS